MTSRPATIMLGLAMLAPLAAAARPAEPRLRLAQAADATGAPSPGTQDAAPDAGTPVPPAPGAPPTGTTPSTTGTAPAANAGPAASPSVEAPTGATRNRSTAVPTLAQPNAGALSPGASSITFGGPQIDVQPTYGSTLRDNGSGNGGVPVYSTAPGTLGGPINGTANSYYATLPNGAVPPGQSTTDGRGTQVQNGSTSFSQQPLGGAAYTRDQTGTFGGRAGYSAQGVYNGTAAQTGNGFGYGSPYATTGRPTGGLLSTGVDATGPLRPYIPLDSGPIGRPNSGYGVPNGSRSTHMDARGIQRVD